MSCFIRPVQYKRNQQVDLIIAERSELGFKAIVEGQHWGMIFKSDVFGKLFIGKRLKGYIKAVREDGKIDLTLQKVGVAKMDDLSEKVLDLLKKKGGFLPLNDKSSPESIFSTFRTSKGTFKKTIGGLYKQGKISIDEQGILNYRFVTKPTRPWKQPSGEERFKTGFYLVPALLVDHSLLDFRPTFLSL